MNVAYTPDSRVEGKIQSSLIQMVHFLFYCGVFTISFDLLSVAIGGFTFRLSQIFLSIPMGIGAVVFIIVKKERLPLGFVSLFFWTVFLLLFINNTTYLTRNIGYFVWHIFNVFLILSTFALFDTREKFLKLYRYYVYSFVCLSAFSYIQFAAGVLGINLFIQQWFKEGFPRVNGFSYEPSYFSTYLFIGWVMVYYLSHFQISLIPQKHLKIMFYVISGAMVLTTSRIGWMLMAGVVAFKLTKSVIGIFTKGRINIKLFGILFLISLSIMGYQLLFGFQNLNFILNGTGLQGTAAHSSIGRMQQFDDTYTVFTNSPIVGYSLGGVSPAIGELNGVRVLDQSDAKRYEGISIFAEVLAASGVFGFIPFVIYIGLIICAPLKLIKKTSYEMKHILLSLIYSLSALLVILQFNQNILRPYLWLHIGIISALYYVIKYQMDGNERTV